MAHELTIRANGKVEMAYTGETPWHGLGEQLTRGASIEEWARAAGMDWRVLKSFVRFPIARGDAPENFRTINDRVVLFRDDGIGDYLGIVSDGYYRFSA